ncbi:hypothetical protein N0V90_012391 [Kalmusia sp. IMI 367209]|nr:hypothetical protein N0V90_012391 [Kalmusia sp. IMI 367209]
MDYIKSFFRDRYDSNEHLPHPKQEQQQYHTHRHSEPTFTWPSAPPPSPRRSPVRSHSRHHGQRYPSPTGARNSAPLQSVQQYPNRFHSRHRDRHHKSKRKHITDPAKMPEQFSGPSCKDLVEFMKSVKDMPSKHKGSFDDISKKSIEAVRDADALHVWESSDDIDNLLQLTQVIVKLKKIAEDARQEGRRRREAAMVIIAEEKKGREGFERICELVRHLIESDGKKHLDGKVCAFDAVVVVRGTNYTSSSDEAAAIKRINTAIERVFKMQRPSTKQLVWHHGPILSLLLTWINATTSDLRSSLTAISVTAAFDLADGVKPSPLGTPNKLPDLQRLESYAIKLGIPVVFVDPISQLITFEYLATYMWYWAAYVHTFFPTPLLRPHFYNALDALVTFCFRLRGASQGVYGASVVRMVQEHLDAGTARRWARTCVESSSYTKDLCRAAGLDSAIHHAVQLADSPFALFDHRTGYPLPAFSRIPLCPSTAPPSSTAGSYIAAPVSFNFKACAFRAASGSPFRILLPREGQDVEKVTARIQGTMMGVVETLRRSKGDPKVSGAEKEMWKGVVDACCWAVDGCEGRCRGGEKVRYVREKLREGTEGCVVGISKGQRGEEWGGNGWGGERSGGHSGNGNGAQGWQTRGAGIWG